MSYPPSTPPGGYNPYETGDDAEVPPVPPAPEVAAQETGQAPQPPPGYPLDPPPTQHWQPPQPGQAPSSAPFQAPPAGQAPAPWQLTGPKNGLGTAALITGILSIVLCWTLLFSIPLAIAAVITGVKGRAAAAQGQATNDGVATAGLITGIVGAVLGVMGIGFIVLLGLS